ncbi:uncharacterized protein LOC121429323 [Lytechinus variegatus]|uniref:uncharacterized protein LOC121429323 n=1 Tax=Lytechinus variegatus TaxID=7654 RepID=UPI001BB26B3C|nr:uncharacterized protein LOC121429323 [Lytechinus variegatus]
MADSLILNVGGKIYQTNKSTLERYPDSIFTSLLKGGASAINQQGHYVLDRDGEVFRHVLNFMRCRELVLPAGFCEYDLLLCEAKFFKLVALQRAIEEETRGEIGLRVGGRTFRMTIEQATREKDSFFDKMLDGRKSVPRDPLGNYLVDRDARMFRFVMLYLRDGGLFFNMSSPELDQLKKEGEYFGLDVMVRHVESFRVMMYIPIGCLQLHIFYHEDSDQYVIYANKAKIDGWFSSWNISEVCSKFAVFKHDQSGASLFVGLLRVSQCTKEQIITILCEKLGAKQMPIKPEVQLSNGWTRLHFTA